MDVGGSKLTALIGMKCPLSHRASCGMEEGYCLALILRHSASSHSLEWYHSMSCQEFQLNPLCKNYWSLWKENSQHPLRLHWLWSCCLWACCLWACHASLRAWGLPQRLGEAPHKKNQSLEESLSQPWFAIRMKNSREWESCMRIRQ